MSDNKHLSFPKVIKISLLIFIILVGAFFRFSGINWDDDFHLHPDERFLTMVETSLSPVSSLREYFDTSRSTLNPHNILDANGNSVFPFFVYGTLPIFLVRYAGEWLGLTGYNEIHIVGRYLSGLFDIGTILVVFLISKNLFKNKWLPYIASLIYASAILPIQISHFFIVDNFATFFSSLAFLFAIKIQRTREIRISKEEQISGKQGKSQVWQGFGNYAFFGIAVGLAAASKINTVVVAALLPVAVTLKDDEWLKDLVSDKWKNRIRNIFLAGIIAFFVFRVFQPYAFSGPGIFGLAPNPRWINNLNELSFISSGDSNYPPSLQWARRSFWFPIKNLVFWGMGLPAGMLAIIGLTFLTYKVFTGGHKKFGLLWAFTFSYLVWQASRWNPTMRYFLIIYPALAIIAAWLLMKFFGLIRKINGARWKEFGLKLVFCVLITTLIISAIGFLNIYRQPMTRIAASEWIYQNIPGAINLLLTDSDREFIQPLPSQHYLNLGSGESFEFHFSPEINGEIIAIRFDHILNRESSDLNGGLKIGISSLKNGAMLYSETLINKFQRGSDSRGEEYLVPLDVPLNLTPDEIYKMSLEVINPENGLQFFGNISLEISNQNLKISQPIFEFARILDSTNGLVTTFSPIKDSQMTGIEFFRLLPVGKNQGLININVTLTDIESATILADKTLPFKSETPKDFRGAPISFEFDNPVTLEQENQYLISVEVLGDSKIALYGSKTAKETDWDDALPLYMHGYNPFDTYEGVYASDINFQMYWDDDQSKLERIVKGLYQADYFIITSSRQWGSITQIPERYPLSSFFYQELIGCKDEDIQRCFRVAEPGMFEGSLGFNLVKTFEVNPSVFGIKFNSQFAEEAFTVYDHPKVFIFRKTDEFNIGIASEILSTVDLDQVLNISIKESEDRPGLLNLRNTQYLKQKGEGTWSKLFTFENPINSNQIISVIVWYLFITVLGWVVYPLVRIAFSGLNDKGFPITKLIGLILWAFISWLASSNGISFNPGLLILTLLIIGMINLFIFYSSKKEIISELKEKKQYYIFAEIISLAFFLFFLLVRLGNPDLWHAYKGGEKPMDFAYLNAIIKSVQFPPYDPWYAGGYINYYYFGFVLAGIIVKFLGIIPSIAYNLILPTFFCFTGTAAFSIGWNLTNHGENEKNGDKKPTISNPYFRGLLTSAFVLIIGNLGTINMVIQGVLRLGMSANQLSGFDLIDKLSYLFSGIIRLFQGSPFSFYPGDWYWIPSRAIPGNVITEFPYFSFLYGDPHAHLLAYPITLVVLGWSLSILKVKFDFSKIFEICLTLFIGALVVGVLRPTNTWDFPVYLSIACMGLAYTVFTGKGVPNSFLPSINIKINRFIFSLLVISMFIVISLVLFSPFDRWYGQAYTEIEFWLGEKTPIWAYFNHWGFFLFILIAWVSFETWRWMKDTPLSEIRPFYEQRRFIYFLLFLIISLITGLFFYGIRIALIAIPLIITIGIFLLFGRTSSKEGMFVQFLVIMGLGLTVIVELVTIKGDIGRMNTVFKFYLQSWTFLSIGSAYSLLELIKIHKKIEGHNISKILLTILIVLSIATLLFPLAGTMDKIKDRMNDVTPLTLDGIEYMKYSTYPENGVLMDLNQDYHAIRWMQENVTGTPVITEAHVPEYRWGNRFSIYTGLPSVIGWNWHQRQQRAINPGEWIFKRVDEVSRFYSTVDETDAKEFIKKYDVEYIILGQLEQAVYPEKGLAKFQKFSGKLWDLVYDTSDTKIYRVKG